MRDSAARELITAGAMAQDAPEPSAAVEPSARPVVAHAAIGPLVAFVSVLAHGAILAAASLLPAPPASAGLLRAPSEIIPFEPQATVEPPPAPPEPVEPVVEPPPEPVRAAVVAPRPRREPRRVEPEPEPPSPTESAERPPAPESAEPAPPAPVLTSGEAGNGTWSHAAGEPGGALDGRPGGRGTATVPSPASSAAPEPAISQEQLRRMLRSYIRGTLSSYLAGRIDYPLAARREQLQGVVTLRIRLARDGRLLAVRLARSSGHSLLDRAALASVEGLGSMPAPPREIPWDDARELPLPVTYQLQ